MLIITRLAFGLLTLIAIGCQLAVHLQGGYSIVNFFSYFTNLSNHFAAAVLLLGVLRMREGQAPVNDLIRAASVVNMAVVGVVFAVLLRKVDLGALMPWVNFVLHVLMPCVVVAEWLWQPPRARLGAGQLLRMTIFPLMYLVYALVRGGAIGWYPYPFLNPTNVGGYAGVAAYAAGITATFLIAGWLLLALGNWRR